MRDDVHALGELIGNVLQDQGGDALLERVEGDRREAIRRREGDPESAVSFALRTSDRAPAEASDLIRAFTQWFQVVNLAEKVHRMRRRQAYQARDDRPQPGGIGDCLYRLRAAGVEGPAVLEMLTSTTVYPVFTAHPTESTRRTVLRNQRRVADLMIERINPSLTAAGRRRIMDGIRSELTLAWQTEEHSRDRLTVADEREHVLFYLSEVIYRVVPAVHEEVAFWMEQVFGRPTRPEDIPCLLRFGS
ncbi:MAG: phosphoenolpyruvate carboxylase, partial [Steroidobacteraceae bacterium]